MVGYAAGFGHSGGHYYSQFNSGAKHDLWPEYGFLVDRECRG